MGCLIEKGRFCARFAETEAEVARALALRGRVFREGGDDRDAFDALFGHVLIEERESGALAGCFRVRVSDRPADLATGYSAAFYDLSSLAGFHAPVLELGRFCAEPALRDGGVLKTAWAALTRLVDDLGIGLMIGCTSFDGTDPAPHAGVLGYLGVAHVAPADWPVGVKAPEVLALADHAPAERRAAFLAMPPLLKTYLTMGGWVSDHAVIDRDLGTLHVFTAVEVGAVPAARARALRAMAV